MKEKYWKNLATQDMGIEEVMNSFLVPVVSPTKLSVHISSSTPQREP